MATVRKPKAEQRVLATDLIRCDSSYQRDEVPTQIAKITNDFDPHALGVLLVARRGDGSYWVVDGLQRLTALRKLGAKVVKVDLFDSSGPQEEAHICKLVNRNRTPFRPTQLFYTSITSGEESAIRIKQIVESAGFCVPLKINTLHHTHQETLARQIGCVVTLQRIYKVSGEEGLKFVLGVVSKCWPGDPVRTRITVLQGLHNFWLWRRQEKNPIDVPRLVTRLNTVTANALNYAAKLGSDSKYENVIAAIERIYKKRLPPSIE